MVVVQGDKLNDTYQNYVAQPLHSLHHPSMLVSPLCRPIIDFKPIKLLCLAIRLCIRVSILGRMEATIQRMRTLHLIAVVVSKQVQVLY